MAFDKGSANMQTIFGLNKEIKSGFNAAFSNIDLKVIILPLTRHSPKPDKKTGGRNWRIINDLDFGTVIISSKIDLSILNEV